MDADTDFGTEWITGAVIFVFSALFGYAFCKRQATEKEEEEVDLSTLKKKDVKTFKKLVEEIHKERDKILKIEEKLARYEELFDKKSSASEFIINEKALKASDSKKSV